jgi:membrane associated rhomboid family serine protease
MDSQHATRVVFYSLLLHLLILLLTLIGWSFPNLIPLLGLTPRSLSGILGIVFHPFFHANWKHLASNFAISLWFFPILILYLHKRFLLCFLTLWLIGGFLVWIFGRSAIHIGESGWLYGFSSYLFWLGMLTRKREHLALSALTILFLSSLFHGLLPINPTISWESHLYYAITGFALAIDSRNQLRKEEPYPEDDESPPFPDHPSNSEDPI